MIWWVKGYGYHTYCGEKSDANKIDMKFDARSEVLYDIFSDMKIFEVKLSILY